MVFFTCNNCGTSLKKNKVDTHLGGCFNSTLCCIDCQKDFTRNSYKAHTSCVSEDQKYGGTDYKPKDSANKNQKKQEQWIENVRMAVSKAPFRVQEQMKRLLDYPNVPRKKPKFANFVKSALHIWDQKMVDQLWAIMEEANRPQPNQSSQNNNDKSADTDDTVTNDKRPAENGSNGSAAKKAKADDEDKTIMQDVEEKEVAAGDDIESGQVQPFKWRKYIKKLLRHQQSGEMSRKDLLKQLRELYNQRHSGQELDKDQLNAVIEPVLSSLNRSKFSVEKKRIKLLTDAN